MEQTLKNMRNKIKNLDKHKKIFIKKKRIHNNLE